MLLHTMDGKVTRWTVHVTNYTWTYEFSNNKVSWKDAAKGTSASGTWAIQNNKLVVMWPTGTRELWDLPLNTNGTGGKCITKQGSYDLKAKALDVYFESEVVLYKRDDFKSKCDAAKDLLMTGPANVKANLDDWLELIGGRYRAASKRFLDKTGEIDKAIKLADDLVIGAILAFVTDGLGGIAGKAIADAKEDGFMVTGFKGLSKFAIKSGADALAGLVAKPALSGIQVMPSDEMWLPTAKIRAHHEIDWAVGLVKKWQHAVEKHPNPFLSSDETVPIGKFDYRFDPVEEIKKSVFLESPLPPFSRRTLLAGPSDADLKSDAIQKQFERGWLHAWIKLNKAHSIVGVTEMSIRDKLLAYGKLVELPNIEDLVNQYYWGDGMVHSGTDNFIKKPLNLAESSGVSL